MNREQNEKSDKNIRTPKQTRSKDTTEKILAAAYQLFCEKGYYKTTTNEIAQRAEVSIGSLYSYYKDKDTIFYAILDKYHQKFDVAKNNFLNNQSMFEEDFKAWLRRLIEALIDVHEESKELNRELTVLSYYNPEVARILEEQRMDTLQSTMSYFNRMMDRFKSKDIEAEALVTFDLISATVDRIVFGKCVLERERLIDTTIDIINKYYNE